MFPNLRILNTLDLKHFDLIAIYEAAEYLKIHLVPFAELISNIDSE